MIEINSCPVCNNNDIVTLLTTLSRYDASFRSFNAAILNHILINVLQMEEVLVYTKQCRRCRQMFVTPTFSQQEMNRLYSEEGNTKLHQFYKKAQEISGLSANEDSCDELLGKPYADESMSFRRKFIYDVVTSYHNGPINKLLDIGGRDGGNILSFDRSDKYVYDLVTPSETHDQIGYINDWSVATSLAPFDLIVSTHTLEHIINTREIVESYTNLLKPGSLFYVEVPLEYARNYTKYLLYPVLKKGTHINWHINYFSPGSLRSLFAVSGYAPLYINTRIMPYSNLRLPVIVGLFVYTGVPEPYYISGLNWYRDFFSNIFMDMKMKGYRKLFKRYPALVPFK